MGYIQSRCERTLCKDLYTVRVHAHKTYWSIKTHPPARPPSQEGVPKKQKPGAPSTASPDTVPVSSLFYAIDTPLAAVVVHDTFGGSSLGSHSHHLDDYCDDETRCLQEQTTRLHVLPPLRPPPSAFRKRRPLSPPHVLTGKSPNCCKYYLSTLPLSPYYINVLFHRYRCTPPHTPPGHLGRVSPVGTFIHRCPPLPQTHRCYGVHWIAQ